MTPQEAKQFLDEQKAQGHSEEEILGVLYSMFVDDTIDFDQLEGLVGLMGYQLTEEFKNMSPEDQKTKGWSDKEEQPEEPKAEEKPATEEEQPKEEAPAAATDPKDDDENEKEKAKQLFGLDK